MSQTKNSCDYIKASVSGGPNNKKVGFEKDNTLPSALELFVLLAVGLPHWALSGCYRGVGRLGFQGVLL